MILIVAFFLVTGYISTFFFKFQQERTNEDAYDSNELAAQ